MTQEPRCSGERRKITAKKTVVLLAAGAAVVGGVGLARSWDGKPYPAADPVVVAARLDDDTQAVYDHLGLPDAQLATDWPGGGAEASGHDCHYRGLNHLSEQLSDSPGNVPGVVMVRNEWALKGVSRAQAVSALQRVRKELTRQGWKVTGYENSRYWLGVSLKPSDSDDVVSVEAYPANRLAVAAHTADCVRYPSGTHLDALDELELPAQVAPVQLRR